MTSHPHRLRIEEILGSDASGPEAEALAALFATATAAPHPGELRGEAAALAAFRAARPVAAGGRTRLRATLLTVKTAVAALVFTSVGGVALAATGALPNPLPTDLWPTNQPIDRGLVDVDAPVTETPAPHTLQVAADPRAVRAAAKAAAAADRTAIRDGRPATFAGLCLVFTSEGWDNTLAAANPSFAPLIAAAPHGDAAGFCRALADETRTAAPAQPDPDRDKNPSPPADTRDPATGKPQTPREKQAGSAPSKPAPAPAPEKTRQEPPPSAPTQPPDLPEPAPAQGGERPQPADRAQLPQLAAPSESGAVLSEWPQLLTAND